ncbi:hypothetical protein [Vibrio quintilis]|uniref:Uncharacterized protein n=1 Tax=Vibrio quintilis TaxID=1117707 RepID=A0A1M7Z2G8_9VIBR|nr:hypothetical protein [Vibrio quintilis]SHO59157.1 hypothetical protein VQ7734_04937 [Vibrio quintilis]
MTDLEELKLWCEIVQRTAAPVDGESPSETENAALARSCRVLAQIATMIADRTEVSATSQAREKDVA